MTSSRCASALVANSEPSLVLHESHCRLIGYILVFYDGLEHRLDFRELPLVSLLVFHDQLL